MRKWRKEDTIMLIEEVKKRPILYDPANEKFLDREARKAAMQDIAINLSQLRPNIYLEEVQRRWNTMRSAFQKCILKMRHQLNGTLTTEFTKVWYFDDMLFLRKVWPMSGSQPSIDEKAVTRDSFIQNDGAGEPILVLEETLDGYGDKSQSPKIIEPENVSKKENIVNSRQSEGLQENVVQEEELMMNNDDEDEPMLALEDSLDGYGDESQSSKIIAPKNYSKKGNIVGCQQSERMQGEIAREEEQIGEDVQSKNLMRESYEWESAQCENLQQGYSLGEGVCQENLEGENVPGEGQDNLRIEDASERRPFTLQREDYESMVDPLAQRDSGIPAKDTGGSSRKRNYEIAFFRTLEYAVKKLMDQSTEDADIIFGKLVSHELKSIKSLLLRKKLKHKILMDIIEVQNLQD